MSRVVQHMIEVQERDVNCRDPAIRNRLLQELTQSEPPTLFQVAEKPVYLFGGRFLPDATTQGVINYLTTTGALRIRTPNAQPAEFDSKLDKNLKAIFASLEHAPELKHFKGLIHHPQVASFGGKFRLAPQGPCYPLSSYVLEAPPLLVPGAKGYLKQWLSGLYYTDPVYHGRLTAWAVALLARAHCAAFPHLFVTSDQKSCGKTRLATALSLFLTGRDDVPVMNYTGNEAEMEVRFSNTLRDRGSPALCVIDNIRAKLGSASEVRSQWLSTAATHTVVWGRALYKGMVPISYPTVILNGVDSAVESDLHDKVWPVMLTLPEGQTEHYAEPDPIRFAREHRAELLSEALGLLEGVELNGTFTYATRFPTFERIAAHVARELELPFSMKSPTTVDQLVMEIFNLVSGTPQPFEEIVKAAQMNDELRELKALVRGSRQATLSGRAESLRKLIGRQYLKRPHHYDGRSFNFVIDKDSANQYTLGIKDIEKC